MRVAQLFISILNLTIVGEEAQLVTNELSLQISCAKSCGSVKSWHTVCILIQKFGIGELILCQRSFLFTTFLSVEKVRIKDEIWQDF